MKIQKQIDKEIAKEKIQITNPLPNDNKLS